MHVNEARRTASIRSVRAIELRAGGATYAAIAKELGCSTGAAFNAVDRGLRRWVKEPLDTVVTMELQRLDALLRAFWSRAVGGDVDAAAFVLKVLERRARMLGLDAPKKLDVSMIVQRWAEQSGLDPTDVLIAAEELLRGL
jgi:hypothetical protein